MENKNQISGFNNDRLMIEMMRENDDHGFVILYKKYWHPLLNFAGHYLADKDTCEEITQELFIQLHLRRLNLKINSSVSSYLYTALRNKILNHIRNQAVYKKHITIAGNISSRIQNNNVDQFIYLKELQQEISVSLECMSAKCREVYILHERDHLTIKKISQILGRPIDTVEKQLGRAKKHLRSYLLSYHPAIERKKAYEKSMNGYIRNSRATKREISQTISAKKEEVSLLTT